MTSEVRKPHPAWVVAVERGLQGLCTAVSAIGALSLAGMFALVLAAVVMRYGWSRPLAFTEELCGLLMTLAVFTLLPMTVMKEINIRVTVVSQTLPPLGQRLLYLLGQLILWAFVAVFVYQAGGISEFTSMLGLKTEQSRLPLAPFMWAATVAMGLVGVVGVWRTFFPVQPAPEDEVHP
jgi:TRAP-type C4-dicarboxylate transport system permease small subunit